MSLDTFLRGPRPRPNPPSPRPWIAPEEFLRVHADPAHAVAVARCAHAARAAWAADLARVPEDHHVAFVFEEGEAVWRALGEAGLIPEAWVEAPPCAWFYGDWTANGASGGEDAWDEDGYRLPIDATGAVAVARHPARVGSLHLLAREALARLGAWTDAPPPDAPPRLFVQVLTYRPTQWPTETIGASGMRWRVNLPGPRGAVRLEELARLVRQQLRARGDLARGATPGEPLLPRERVRNEDLALAAVGYDRLARAGATLDLRHHPAADGRMAGGLPDALGEAIARRAGVAYAALPNPFTAFLDMARLGVVPVAVEGHRLLVHLPLVQVAEGGNRFACEPDVEAPEPRWRVVASVYDGLRPSEVRFGNLAEARRFAHTREVNEGTLRPGATLPPLPTEAR